MEYKAPEQEPYESGLTAQAMYDNVDALLKSLTPQERKSSIQQWDDSAKLWMTPRIRTELEEYVASYFSGDLQLPEPSSLENTTLPDFNNVFVNTDDGLKIEEKKLHDYIEGLKQCYDSKDEANKSVIVLFQSLSNRGDTLYKVTNEIDNMDGVFEVKRNTRDAFGHIALVYFSIQLARMDLGI